jgi:PIN domain nuclease of toxin-antitoxin system
MKLLQKALTLAPLREAPLTHEIALATRSVRLPHRDPADRFLVATALIHGLTLVTADQNVGSSKQIPVLLNPAKPIRAVEARELKTGTASPDAAVVGW